jgi:membrane protease YdiL (CAAX protease family)
LETNESDFQSKLTLTGVNIVYLLGMVLLITAGAFVQTRSFNSGILITEFVLIALPVFLYVVLKKGKLKQELRFNKLGFMNALLVTLIFVFAYPVALFVSVIGNLFVSLFGKLIQSPIPLAENFNEYFVLIMIVAGSAGICEELLFRGLIMRGYEKLGKWPNIIFTAILFSMLHINIQNVLGPLFLGIVLGYVVYTTNSIFAGMLGHFVNNAMSVTISFVIMRLMPFANNAAAQDVPQGMMIQGLLIWAVFIGLYAAVSGVIMYFCIKALQEINRDRIASAENIEKSREKQSLSKVLKNARIAWPLYISMCIFVFYAVAEFAYVITGQSLFDIIF